MATIRRHPADGENPVPDPDLRALFEWLCWATIGGVGLIIVMAAVYCAIGPR